MKYTLKWKVLNFIEIWSRDINIWAYKHCNKEGDRMLKKRAGSRK